MEAEAQPTRHLLDDLDEPPGGLLTAVIGREGAAVLREPRAQSRVAGQPADRRGQDLAPRGGDWLQQRPGELFKFLLCARGPPATTETIAGALWPDRGPSAIANVRYFVHRVREYLERRGGPSDAQSLIIRRGGGYVLDPDRLVIDVDVFEKTILTALAAVEADMGDPDDQLGQALALYRDDFLCDLPYRRMGVDGA